MSFSHLFSIKAQEVLKVTLNWRRVIVRYACALKLGANFDFDTKFSPNSRME